MDAKEQLAELRRVLEGIVPAFHWSGHALTDRLDALGRALSADRGEAAYTLAMIEDAWNVSVPLLGDYCERFKAAIVEMSRVSDVPMIGNPLMVGLRDPIICDDASLEVALREIAAGREAAAPSGVSDADDLTILQAVLIAWGGNSPRESKALENAIAALQQPQPGRVEGME